MLSGSLVRLRLMTSADAELVSSWYGDPDFGGFYVVTTPYSPEMVERHIGEQRVSPERAEYLVLERETDTPVGLCGHYHYTELPWMHGLEIGYTIHPRGRGRGVATQVARLLVNHLFDGTQIQRVQATVTVGNDPSCKVLSNAGMRQEGIMRSAIFLHGQYRDLQLFAITREDWADEAAYRERYPW